MDASGRAQLRQALQRRNASSLRVAALLGVSLVPLFWVLDWLVLPDHVVGLGVLRLASTAFGCFLLVAHSRRPAWVRRHVDALTIAFAYMVGWSIALMCWLHEGYASPYYAGICLVVISVGYLFAWPTRLSAPFFGLMYLFYMGPLVVGLLPAGELEIFASNQFFLIATIIMTLASQRHRFQLEVREFSTNLDLQQAKDSLEGAVEGLKELDRLKTTFFSNITHELRTPLTLILAPLESILAGELGNFDERQKASLRPTRRAALRLLRLINDLLDMAQLEERFLKLQPERCDLSLLLGSIVDYSRPLAARKRIDLQLHVAGDPPELTIDVQKMERVVVNLLSNALKFTPEKGQVVVTLQDAQDEVLLEVRDSGIGIPADMLESIFERFRQADGSVTRRFGGTGIGLALAKELVELHGGCIEVESEHEQGSLFRIRLRKGQEHLPEALVAPQEEGPQGPREWTQQLQARQSYRFLEIEEATDRRMALRAEPRAMATKVLVVEDTQDVLQLLQLQLKDEHAVYLAANGLQGLELARRELPDVIISDYMMPEMDGIEMLRHLRNDPATADIPVVLLTARSRLDDRIDLRKAGADVYLSKPFSSAELKAVVMQLLEKRGRQAGMVAREQVRSLEAIASGLAHEIHNPLSYIRTALVVIGEKLNSLTALLEREDLDSEERAQRVEPLQQRIERMQGVAEQGVQRLEGVVQLVRQYAREGFSEEAVPHPLDEAVRNVLALVAPRDGAETELTLDLQAADGKVGCVPEELHQVIRNLVQNALDAAGDKGQVAVRTRAEGDQLVLEVEDDGPGITREQLGRIFTPFFTTKEPGMGMGLGLTITLQTVTRLGGSIRTHSVPGQGTRFRVRLPLAAAPQP